MRFFRYGMLLACLVGISLFMMQEHSCDHVKKAIQSIGNPRSKGVVRFKSGASRGYILFSPLLSTTTYLIDIKGDRGPERITDKRLQRLKTLGYISDDTTKKDFNADFISGAHRLVNGNTFICSGPRGRFFEVTPNGDIVWQYENPYSGHAANPAGDPPYSVFRATHSPPDHPALVNRVLKPLDPQPPYLWP